jgi:hypothetical protein
MKRTIWRIAAVAATALGVMSAASAGLLGASKSAPAWSGKTVAGKPIASSQYKGKALLMNFFSYG